ncbi:glycine/betaine ABC transporter substrate-binding protein [Arthrobacter sp. MYb227]|uniref:ABC transporter substrate-binding protein n=1 Tax=Arthrobacter sp. MYb227 TaxID=1848601 RepID=UPI000CFCC8E5|nr:ABC transporter substrate-binding protein [Arthrobacter sp. MYb227]PQZ92903.1 glycine/betaine ABC transporter substrate-binding protein [Arthrobacter sp. MYb227]
MKKHLKKTALLMAGTMLLASGCAASDPLAKAGTKSDTEIITIGSANFPENVILGEIYAKSLEDAGYGVERKLNIGAREVLYSQVENCTLSVVPEYNQALLAFIAPEAVAKGTAAVDAALQENLPSNLMILDSAPAQDNNAVGVLGSTAEKYGLETIEDLSKVSKDLAFGGPTEWKTRHDGYSGLEKDYKVAFKEYKLLDYSGPITISALEKGDVDAALIFSTAPQIKSMGFKILEDPKNTIGVNNIVPLLCKDSVPAEARAVIESINAKLTTDDLTAMNASFILDHRDAADVASDWVAEQGK